MRRHLRVLPVLLLLLLVACANSASGKWKQASILFRTAEQTIITMHDKELIDNDQLKDMKPALMAGKTALDESYLLLPDGGTDFDALLNIVLAVTNELEAYYLPEPE